MGSKENFSVLEVNDQLNRILSTPTFKSSTILSGFLQYVIEQTLAGKQQEIKEYTIGIHALSRHSDFNPQLDAIVRIHAGRLRRALKEYYFEQGKNDAIIIEIPKGSYIPFFQSQNGLEKPAVSEKIKPPRTKPVVAVLPFRNISKDPARDFFADGLAEQLSTELTWFHDLAVVSYYSCRHVAGLTSDIKEAAKLLGSAYVLTGSIQNDKTHLRIGVQLISGENGQQLWAKSFERNNTASGLFEIQNEIVRNVLTAIGGYYGAIFRDVLKESFDTSASSIETYDAIFWYYHYQKVFTPEVFQKAIGALEAAVKAEPGYALAWAMLGELYLDDKAMDFKKIDNPIQQGLEFAQRAVALDPVCQHGYMALGWIYLFHQNREESLKAVEQCLAINPNSIDKAGAMGFVLVCAGENERGFELLNNSGKHNPFCPWWYHVGSVFYFLCKKEYQQALTWAGKVSRPDLFWDPMMKAIALAQLNRMEEARKNLDLLLQLMPDIGSQLKDVLQFVLSQDLHNEIHEGLRKAGLNIENQTSTIEAKA